MHIYCNVKTASASNIHVICICINNLSIICPCFHPCQKNILLLTQSCHIPSVFPFQEVSKSACTILKHASTPGGLSYISHRARALPHRYVCYQLPELIHEELYMLVFAFNFLHQKIPCQKDKSSVLHVKCMFGAQIKKVPIICFH